MSARRRIADWMSGHDVPRGILWPAVFAAVALTFTLSIVNVGLLQIDPVPDLLHPATPETLHAALANLGDRERAGYLYAAWLDWLYPPAYAIALSGILARIGPRRPGFLPWLPVATALFDLVENTLFIGLISGMLPENPTTLLLGAGANRLKWLLGDTTLLLVFASLVWWLLRNTRVEDQQHRP